MTDSPTTRSFDGSLSDYDMVEIRPEINDDALDNISILSNISDLDHGDVSDQMWSDDERASVDNQTNEVTTPSSSSQGADSPPEIDEDEAISNSILTNTLEFSANLPDSASLRIPTASTELHAPRREIPITFWRNALKHCHRNEWSMPCSPLPDSTERVKLIPTIKGNSKKINVLIFSYKSLIKDRFDYIDIARKMVMAGYDASIYFYDLYSIENRVLTDDEAYLETKGQRIQYGYLHSSEDHEAEAPLTYSNTLVIVDYTYLTDFRVLADLNILISKRHFTTFSISDNEYYQSHLSGSEIFITSGMPTLRLEVDPLLLSYHDLILQDCVFDDVMDVFETRSAKKVYELEPVQELCDLSLDNVSRQFSRASKNVVVNSVFGIFKFLANMLFYVGFSGVLLMMFSNRFTRTVHLTAAVGELGEPLGFDMNFPVFSEPNVQGFFTNFDEFGNEVSSWTVDSRSAGLFNREMAIPLTKQFGVIKGYLAAYESENKISQTKVLVRYGATVDTLIPNEDLIVAQYKHVWKAGSKKKSGYMTRERHETMEKQQPLIHYQDRMAALRDDSAKLAQNFFRGALVMAGTVQDFTLELMESLQVVAKEMRALSVVHWNHLCEIVEQGWGKLSLEEYKNLLGFQGLSK